MSDLISFRAITIRQPYASAFFSGLKCYESRNFKTKTGPLGIIAALNGDTPHGLLGFVNITGVFTVDELPRRQVPSMCFDRRWYWCASSNVPLETPLPIPGFQGIRTVTVDDETFWNHAGVWGPELTDVLDLDETQP